MAESTAIKKKSGRGRGFRCVTGTTLSLMSGAFSYSTFSMIMVAFLEYSGFDAVQASFIFTAYSLGSMLSSLIFGPLVNRFSAKIVCAVFGLGPLAAYLAMAYCSNIYVIYVLAVFWGAVQVMSGIQLHMVLTNRWFTQGNGTIITLTSTVRKIVQLVYNPAIAAMVTALGFQKAATILGVGFFLLILVAAVFLINNGPGEEYETISFTSKKKEAKESGKKKAEQVDDGFEPAMSPAQLLRNPYVIVAIVAAAPIALASTMYYTNQSLIYAGAGLDLMQTSLLFSIGAASGMVISPLFGLTSDIIGSRKALCIFLAIGVVMYLQFPVVGGYIGCGLLAAFCDIGNLNQYYAGVALPPLVGKKVTNTYIGWANVVAALLCMFAAPIGASVAVAMGGNYAYTIMLCAVCFVIAIVLVWIALSDKARKSVREMDANYRASHGIEQDSAEKPAA